MHQYHCNTVIIVLQLSFTALHSITATLQLSECTNYCVVLNYHNVPTTTVILHSACALNSKHICLHISYFFLYIDAKNEIHPRVYGFPNKHTQWPFRRILVVMENTITKERLLQIITVTVHPIFSHSHRSPCMNITNHLQQCEYVQKQNWQKSDSGGLHTDAIIDLVRSDTWLQSSITKKGSMEMTGNHNS